MKLPANTVQTSFVSPLGRLILASADGQLVGTWFADQAHLPDLSACPLDDHNPMMQQAITQLNGYFGGLRTGFDLPLNTGTGTAFQQAVWQALLSIPWGSCCSYSALGKRIGKPAAVRAVGAAVGRNPLSIIVPCHRVIGANGSLTGYAGGLPRKTALLQLEGAL